VLVKFSSAIRRTISEQLEMSMQADDAQAHSPSVENAVQHNSGTWWRTQFLLHVEKGAFPNLDGARFVSALLERAAALEKLSPTVAELLAENKKLHACMARRQVASADVAVNQTQNSEQLIHNLRIENTNLRKEIDDGHVALSKLTSLVLASKSNCFVDALEAVPVPVSAPNSTARTTADDVNQAADSKAAEPEQKPAVSTDNEKTLPVVTLPTCRKTPPELKLTASIQKSQKQVPSAKGTSPVSVCPGLQRGDRVLGRFQDGELWYPGTITEVLTGSTFRVQYDDGDVEIFVRAEDVLSLPSRAEAQVSKYGAVSLQRALQLVRRPRSRKSRPRSENSRARSQKSRARSQKSRRRSRKPKSVAEPMSQRFQVWTAKFNLFKDFVSEFGHPKVGCFVVVLN